MTIEQLRVTVPVIRVSEIAKGQCFECVFEEEAENKLHTGCGYIQSVHGSCRDNACVYILNTSESVTRYAKVRVTE